MPDIPVDGLPHQQACIYATDEDEHRSTGRLVHIPVDPQDPYRLTVRTRL